MNSKAKKRLTIVGGIVVIVAVILFVVLGSGGTAKALSVADAASGTYDGKKVQVSGQVVKDSYRTEGTEAVFSVTDGDGSSSELEVRYGGALPSSFGNGVTAICTGTVRGGTLAASTLVTASTMVTKCPSKYESAEGAVTADALTSNVSAYAGQEVKLAGYVTPGSIADVSADVRFNVNSQGGNVDVAFDGALPDGMGDGIAVVVTGKLSEDGSRFEASDVSVDASVANQE